MPRHTAHLRLRPNGPAPEAVAPPAEPENFEPWMQHMVFDTAGAMRFLGNMSESELHRLRRAGRIVALQDGPGCRLCWPFLSLKAYLDGLRKLECVGGK